MKKLVVFDLDGTLLNTIDDLGNACNYALRAFGFSEHPLASYNYMVGNGVRKLMERAAPDANEEVVDKLLKLFREFYDDHCTDFTVPYDGIPDLLRSLRERDINIAVTSNKYEAAVKKIINFYFPDIKFSSLLGQIEGRPIKPDPSIVFTALSECPTRKADVLYVGDSGVDMETARRACVDSVGVTWGFRPVSELRKAYANYIVNSPEDIFRIATEKYVSLLT